MIRILIADDSMVISLMLKAILNAENDFEVIGLARNGEEAIQMAQKLKPDLITMDIRMPVMDGFEATDEIMSTIPTPIVVVSSSVDAEELRITFRAIEKGALAVIEKPFGSKHPDFEKGRRDMVHTIRAMASVKVVTRDKRTRRIQSLKKRHTEKIIAKPFEMVAIGCSTGGPQVLREILPSLPANFPSPIVIVQHISRGFMPGLVTWLNSSCSMHVKVAEHEEFLHPGTIYFAPDDKHLLINRCHNAQLATYLSENPPVGQFRPSATPLMQSAAKACGELAIGILLTGMGDDGASGLLTLRQAGGHTLVQDKESSVVYGMPAVALKINAVDKVVDLNEIASYLEKVVQR